MKKFLPIVLIALMVSSCAQWSKSEKRNVASDGKVIEQPDLLATMLGRKPIRTLTDLINEGASADELSKYNFSAIHPVLMAGYYSVNVLSAKGDGYYVLESKTDVKAQIAGYKGADGKEYGPGTIGFAKKFSDHSNNIIFEMPNGSFNRPDFVVGKQICTKKGTVGFNFCGKILRIYSSGELLVMLKNDTTIAAIELF